MALLAHAVLDAIDQGLIPERDDDEELSRRAARAGLAYQGDRTRKALDAARATRRRRHAAVEDAR
jgi:hypothetical protein